jgi:hypothetical protein
MSEEMRLSGRTPKDVADRWLNQASKQAEYFIPVVIPGIDIAKEYFDKAHDKDGSTFYKILKDQFTDYDLALDQDLRNNYQGLTDKWLTALFGTTKVDE